MPNFAELINTPPMDPVDNRFFYGLDFVDVITDGDTLANPTATIEAAGTTAGVTITNVVLTETTKIVFKVAVSVGQQSNARWDGDGRKYLVTVLIENAAGDPIERSGLIWIAQR